MANEKLATISIHSSRERQTENIPTHQPNYDYDI